MTALPTVDKQFAMMVGRPRGQTRKGPAAPRLRRRRRAADADEQGGRIHRPARRRRQDGQAVLSLPAAQRSPHTPILPTAEWQGKSGLNPYADFVMQTDCGTLGAVLDALDKNGLADNTLVIVTSDNGCSPQAKFDELLAKGHDPELRLPRPQGRHLTTAGTAIPFIGSLARQGSSRAATATSSSA